MGNDNTSLGCDYTPTCNYQCYCGAAPDCCFSCARSGETCAKSTCSNCDTCWCIQSSVEEEVEGFGALALDEPVLDEVKQLDRAEILSGTDMQKDVVLPEGQPLVLINDNTTLGCNYTPTCNYQCYCGAAPDCCFSCARSGETCAKSTCSNCDTCWCIQSSGAEELNDAKLLLV